MPVGPFDYATRQKVEIERGQETGRPTAEAAANMRVIRQPTKREAAKYALLRGGELKLEIANRLGLELETVERIAQTLRHRPENDYDYDRKPNPWA